MSVVLCAFGYPAYPKEHMLGRIRESQVFLEKIGIQFESAEPVIELRDCKQALKKLHASEWDALIIVVSTWVEAPHVVSIASQFQNRPILLWVHENLPPDENGDVLSLGSIAAGGVLRETFEELGFLFSFVVGNPYEEKIVQSIQNFIRAARTIRMLRNARLGMVGYASMGMYTAMADPLKVKRFFGTEIVHIDQYSILSFLDQADMASVEKLQRTLRENWTLPENVDPELLEKTGRIMVRLRSLSQDHTLDAVTVKCQYEMSLEYGFSPCVALSLLGEEMPVSCEGDILLLLTQLILSGLTDRVTTYGDVLAFLPDGVISAACGFAPRCFLKQEKPHIEQHTAIVSGLLVTSRFREGQVTMARLANRGDGFKMHCILGRMEELRNFREIGCPPYAGTVIRFENTPIEDFKQNIMSQHYALVRGDWIEALQEFCRLSGIHVISASEEE